MKLRERFDRIAFVASRIARLTAGDVRAHWVSALFSLVVAFGVWLAIEDFSDPREETRAPANSGIPVQAVNVPDGYLEPALATVIVRVRGRESDIRDLRPEDFRATLDFADHDSGGEGAALPVRVTSRRDGVEVLEVIPPTMRVALEPAEEKIVEITANILASPPSGFQVKQSDGADGRELPPQITPAFVTVTGPAALVDRVARVDLDVDLSNARSERYSQKGDLVARSEDGNVLDVRISPATQAEAVFQIESIFAPRTVGISPQRTGEPARGYRVVDITVEPPTIEVTGPQTVIENLQAPLFVGEIDIDGLSATLEQARPIQLPANVESETRSVLVTIVIEPTPATTTVYPNVQPTEIPAGLTILPGTNLTTRVVISGNLLDVDKVVGDPGVLQMTVSLAEAQAGTITPTPRFTAPGGVKVESVEPVTIVLGPSP